MGRHLGGHSELACNAVHKANLLKGDCLANKPNPARPKHCLVSNLRIQIEEIKANKGKQERDN